MGNINIRTKAVRALVLETIRIASTLWQVFKRKELATKNAELTEDLGLDPMELFAERQAVRPAYEKGDCWPGSASGRGRSRKHPRKKHADGER
ncbi:MAG: hypothetical protein HFI93_00030 [Lachnospiraceae bacterium]|nr:hypothetical protein [Lachnospiraceae bacterium]